MRQLNLQRIFVIAVIFPFLTACSVSALLENINLAEESISEVSVDANSYDFGKANIAGGTVEKTILLRNSSEEKISDLSASIDFSSASLASTPFRFKGGTYPGTGGDCSSELDADSQCQVVVLYDPAVAQNDGGEIIFDYTLKQIPGVAKTTILGTGVDPAILSISDGLSYDFGSVTVGSSSTTKTFTVTNTGGEATAVMESSLTIPFVYEGAAYPGTGGTCGTTISAGGACTLVVKFSPLIAGAATGRIELSYNDGLIARTTDRDVEGIGLAPNVAPVATAQTLSSVLAETGTAITLAGTDANGDPLTYALVSGPSHGSLTGTIPNYTYTAAAGYTGADSFTFKVNDGTVDSATATVSITVVPHIIYLRTTGSDGTAVINDAAFPFSTAQGVATAIVGRSITVPTIVDVGSGNFGNIRVYSSFGSNVTWRGVSRVASIIGDIDASGAQGADAFDDGMGGVGSAQPGANGSNVFVYSENNIKFGTVLVYGGNGGNGVGSSYPNGANGGSGGQVIIGSNVQVSGINLNGGGPGSGDAVYGGSNGSYGSGGGSTISGKTGPIVSTSTLHTIKSGGDVTNVLITGGTVLIEAGGQAAYVDVTGSGDPYISAGSVTVHGTVTTNIIANGGDEGTNMAGSYSGGSGGSVTIEATGTVGGSIEANGGGGNNTGGSIIVKGSVAGTVAAQGGSDIGSGAGGSGGQVNVWAGGTVSGISVSGSGGGSTAGSAGTVTVSGSSGYIDAMGGSNFSFGNGGLGGTITLNSGAVVGVVTADGGGGSISPPGSGGTIYVHAGARAQDIYASGGSAQVNPGPGAPGGTVVVDAGGTSGHIVARGGNSSGDPGNAGAGGSVTVDPAAISYYDPTPISIFNSAGDDL